MRVLSFDFGLKFLGVAAGQSITNTAAGVTTLRCNEGKPKWREIKTLTEKYAPDTLVVGLPLNMDGSESEMSRLARNFGRELSRRTGRSVVFQDERLTSKSAESELEHAQAYGQAETDHELAACMIAEDFLRTLNR